MAVQYLESLRNSRLDEITTAAGAAAYLQVWDGALPATPATAPAGTMLASLAMTTTNIAAAASAGVLTMSAISDDTNADASGTPTFARIATNEAGTTTGVVQMSAGVGSGDLNFDAAIVAAGTVSVSSLTITDGSS